MTQRFGAIVCIKCTMTGHLSYQCKRPIVDLTAEPVQQEPAPTDAELDRDLYDDWMGCFLPVDNNG